MKKTYVLMLGGVAAFALFVALVYAILRATHLAEPAAVTVHGYTGKRAWATAMVLLALVAATLGCLAAGNPQGRFGFSAVRIGVIAAGTIAAINGGAVLAAANGGPGTGNGVVGGAAALVLGVVAVLAGALAWYRAS